MTPRPRLLERWLRAVIPDTDAREGVLGDLTEEHARRVRRYGRLVARAWYVSAVLTTIVWYLRARWRRRADGPAIRLGGTPKRDPMVRRLWDDGQIAVRGLRRAPAFSLVAILTIALGIGSTTAIFAVLDGVVLKPLPYDDGDRVVRIEHTSSAARVERLGATNGMYFQYGEHATTLDAFALYLEQSVPMGGETEGQPAREVGVIIATPSLFSILGVAPLLGRLFTEDEIQPGAPDVAVLSYRFWKTHYGGDSTVIGRPISSGAPIPIVGVLPEWFDFVRPKAPISFGSAFEQPDIYIPLTLNRTTARFGNFMYQAIGRLAPGVAIDSASRELTTLMRQMPTVYPENGLTDRMVEEGGYRPIVEPLKQSLIGDMGGVLWILMGAVVFVLLIALVNVLNLLMVRTESRRREIAVRRALGATTPQMLRAFFVDALLLASVGGALGLALTSIGTKILLRIAPPDIPRLDQVTIDGRALVFTVGLALFVAIALGLLPIARLTTLNLATAARDESRAATAGRGYLRTRQTLVVTQVAFALVLLVASGLLVRTFWNLRNVHAGFGTAENQTVLTVRLTLDGDNVNTPRQRTDYLLALTERLEGLPAVRAASFAGDLPVNDVVFSAEIATADAPPEAGTQAPIAMRNFVGPGYLRAIGASLLQGRELERRDYAADPDVVVVNHAFAQQRWPGQNPIGKRLVQWPAEEGTWYRVVGVVSDIHEISLAEEPQPMVYLPTVFLPGSTYGMFVTNYAIVLQVLGDPLALLPAVQGEISAMGSIVPITSVATLDEIKAASIRQISFAMVLLVTAGTASLLLGIVGIYGVVSYVVTQRTRELGLRIVLGARRGQVRSLVLRQGTAVAAIGVAIGLTGAVLASRLLQSMLFGVASMDLATYAVMSLLLVAVVIAATLIPASRAASVNPLEALRTE